MPLPSPIPHPRSSFDANAAIDRVIGGDWPDGDERALRSLSDQWHEAAKLVGPLLDDARRAVSTAVAAFGGADTRQGEALERLWQRIDASVSADTFKELGDLAAAGARVIEAAKLEISVAVTQMMADLEVLGVLSSSTLGVSAAGTQPVMLSTRHVISRVLDRAVSELHDLGSRAKRANLGQLSFGVPVLAELGTSAGGGQTTVDAQAAGSGPVEGAGVMMAYGMMGTLGAASSFAGAAGGGAARGTALRGRYGEPALRGRGADVLSGVTVSVISNATVAAKWPDLPPVAPAEPPRPRLASREATEALSSLDNPRLASASEPVTGARQAAQPPFAGTAATIPTQPAGAPPVASPIVPPPSVAAPSAVAPAATGPASRVAPPPAVIPAPVVSQPAPATRPTVSPAAPLPSALPQSTAGPAIKPGPSAVPPLVAPPAAAVPHSATATGPVSKLAPPVVPPPVAGSTVAPPPAATPHSATAASPVSKPAPPAAPPPPAAAPLGATATGPAQPAAQPQGATATGPAQKPASPQPAAQSQSAAVTSAARAATAAGAGSFTLSALAQPADPLAQAQPQPQSQQPEPRLEDRPESEQEPRPEPFLLLMQAQAASTPITAATPGAEPAADEPDPDAYEWLIAQAVGAQVKSGPEPRPLPPVHQRALEDSRPEQFGDLQGDWLHLINAGGPVADPERATNAADVAQSLLDTWLHGRVRVASPGTHQMELNERLQRLRPDEQGLARVQAALRVEGHGACAVIVQERAYGERHATTVHNRLGELFYVDAQRRVAPVSTVPPIIAGVVRLEAFALTGGASPIDLVRGATPRE